MKDNNTQDRKRLFAQYFWQKVYKSPYFEELDYLSGDKITFTTGYLLLTSLSAITKEHKQYLKELLGIDDFTNQDNATQFIKCLRDSRNWLMGNNEDVQLLLQGCDYLRSKGYALPFMGISVEEQVSKGWIKLKGGTV